MSPAVYWAAGARPVPVVQTLHNFRLLCPQAMLLREGLVCEDCVGKVPWRAVLHGCYRDSRPHSAALAAMLVAHRWLGTLDRRISRYIALNDFCRDVFVRGGLPADRMRVKPNFVDDLPMGRRVSDRGSCSSAAFHRKRVWRCCRGRWRNRPSSVAKSSVPGRRRMRFAAWLERVSRVGRTLTM